MSKQCHLPGRTALAMHSSRLSLTAWRPLVTGLPFLLVLLLSIAANGASASDSMYSRIIIPSAIEAVFQPRYRRFTEVSQQLHLSAQNTCQTPSAKTLTQLKDNFQSVVHAFAEIEMYRIGPMLEKLRQNRLFYWPDKRRVGERQLRQLLADPASATLTLPELEEKSVALQGLPALERLLYGKNATEKLNDGNMPDCHLLTVISANVHSMARTIDEGWSNDSTLVTSMRMPSAQSDLYRTEQEVLKRLVTQIVVGIDIVLNSKIMLLVGEDTNFKKSPLWLSELTIPMITGNLDGLRALLIDSGLAAKTNLQDELGFEFESANTILERLSLLPTLTDDGIQLTQEARSLAQTLLSIVRAIDITLDDRFLKSLGITAGFNSQDGD